jgi:16S rRNA (cytosine967-C5)-methyltransferase
VTPAARVQAAIEVIDEWQAGDAGLDRVLTRWGRAHRFAGSGDRHAIADLVYDTVRRMRSAAWVAGVPDPAPVEGRALLRGCLMLDGADPGAFFTGERHAPAPLDEPERRPARPLADAPRAVRLDLPEWLEPELAGVEDAVLEALCERAPVDLRVNLLKGGPDEAVAALARDGIQTKPVSLSHTALRVQTGQRRVAGSRAYRQGLVEIQDAASQAVADFGRARPEETVLDLCAGGGGKTLALAAAMQNRGRLIAHDVAAQRIAALLERAARAGARVRVVGSAGLQALRGACDLVFVDAPCSGSGAWRRNPDAKWRLTPVALDGFAEAQDALLNQAATLTRPGGRILYATCSILPRENRARVDAFLARATGWRLVETCAPAPPLGDGFFGALLENTSGQR